jgi:hypothetical protein
MRGMLDSALERRRAKNTPIDMTPQHMLKTFLTTGSGWILRKATEALTVASASAGAYLSAHNVPNSVITPTQALIVAGGTWALSLGLSWMADKANKDLPPPAK